MVESDLELLDSALKGDTEAFSKLVQKYQKPIYFLALRMTSWEHDEAADITQQTFINAFRSLGKFKRQSSFKTWLYQIGINLCLNSVKGKKKNPTSVDIADVDIIDTEESPFDKLSQNNRSNRISQAILELPEQQRLTVILRVYEGYSYKQIADTLGCIQTTARVNYHHGIQNLRKALQKEQAHEL